MKPIKQIKAGNITATIWKEKKCMVSLSKKGYKDQRLDLPDIPKAIKCLSKAYEWICLDSEK